MGLFQHCIESHLRLYISWSASARFIVLIQIVSTTIRHSRHGSNNKTQHLMALRCLIISEWSFYNLVIRDHCGSIVEEMFRIQKIRAFQSLLKPFDVFQFLNRNSTSLEQFKGKVAFRLNNDECRIKCEIKANVDFFIQTWTWISDKLFQSNPILTNMNHDTNIIEDLFFSSSSNLIISHRILI